MSKLYFTSDLHLGHANIMKYCGRTIFMTKEDKFKYGCSLSLSDAEQKSFKVSDQSVYNMNEGIINRWNERVKPGDTVIHVGDFLFKNKRNRGEGIDVKAVSYEERLNGKIVFIKGNHDYNNTCKTKIYSLQLKMDSHYINAVHDPIFANVNYSVNITGHVHGEWECQRIRLGESFTDCVNCGVDVWNFCPVTYEELKGRLWRWRKKSSLS